MASTVWRGYITFGLISIPVRLFRAARAERVSFRRLYREEPRQEPERPRQRSLAVEPDRPLKRLAYEDQQAEAPANASARPASTEEQPEPILTPVQQVSVRKGSDDVLPERSLVKGYEYEKDRFVVVEPEELKSAARATSTQMEIQEFVQLAEIDPIYFETSYYMTPEQAGEKAYALSVPLYATDRTRRRGPIRNAQSGARGRFAARQNGPSRAHHVLQFGSSS